MPPRIENREPSRHRSFRTSDRVWFAARQQSENRGVSLTEALNVSMEAFIRVSDETWDRLNRVAEERGLRLSEVMNLAFEAYATSGPGAASKPADA